MPRSRSGRSGGSRSAYLRKKPAKHRFIRFVAGMPDENAYELTGIFATARLLRDDGKLSEIEAAWLEEVFQWFGDNLPCPPFQKMRQKRRWSRDAVSWFKSDARIPIRRMWDLVALLKEKGVAVRLIYTKLPGDIVYEDRYQIVAETPDDIVQDERLA